MARKYGWVTEIYDDDKIASTEAQYLSEIDSTVSKIDRRLEKIEYSSEQQRKHLEMIENDTMQLRGALYLIIILMLIALYHFW